MGEKQADESTKKFQKRWKKGKTAVNIMRRQSRKLKKAEQQHKKVLTDHERRRMR